jgi:hypothetical protein
MNIRAEFTFCPLSAHRRDHAFADNECTDVGAAGLLDELLYQDVDLDPTESLIGLLGFVGESGHR